MAMHLKSNILSLVLVFVYTGKSEGCDLLFNGSCYQKGDTRFNWYDARNECLDNGGDLASFQTLNDFNKSVSLKNLSLTSNEIYWIGMQKNEWQWEDTGQPLYLSLCFSVSVSASVFLLFSFSCSHFFLSVGSL